MQLCRVDGALLLTKLPRKYLKGIVRILLITVVIALGYWLYHWYIYEYTYTRDAYVYANVINMASQVNGHVEKVYAEDNEFVKKGQTLFVIDQEPYKYKLAQATAHLNHVKSMLNDMSAQIQSSYDLYIKQEVALSQAKDILKRLEALYKQNAISLIKYNNAKSNVSSLEEAVKASKEKWTFLKGQVDNSLITQAKAAYDQAAYDLDNTYIKAPDSGYITNFNISPGDYISQGMPLFALVDTKSWWVIARFKETLIRLIKKGDQASISLSMYPGVTFTGVVDSIGWGINRSQSSPDAAPSTLTYLSPTEDWIKISQRFPVRIKVQAKTKYPFRVGATAHVKITN